MNRGEKENIEIYLNHRHKPRMSISLRNFERFKRQMTLNRCSSAYISKRQRHKHRAICYRHFPLSCNAQKLRINQQTTSIDVRKITDKKNDSIACIPIGTSPLVFFLNFLVRIFLFDFK